MSIGCVQAIEYNKWDVGIAKIERYAAVFGTTADRLLHPEVMQPLDPKWEDLNNDEHLAIARQYMKALKATRAAVEAILAATARNRETVNELAEMVLALQEDRKLWQLWVAVQDRLEANPTFERELEELIEKTKPK